MNSPVDPALMKLVQQELKSLQDDVKNMSAECDKEKSKLQSELQNAVSVLEEMEQKMERLEIRQQNAESEIGDVKDRMSAVEDTIYKREGNLKASMCIGAVQQIFVYFAKASVISSEIQARSIIFSYQTLSSLTNLKRSRHPTSKQKIFLSAVKTDRFFIYAP